MTETASQPSLTTVISSDSAPPPKLPRYLVKDKRRGVWCYMPTKEMKAKGFMFVNFGRFLSAEAIERIERFNADWDALRSDAKTPDSARPERTLARGYQEIYGLRCIERERAGLPPDGKHSDWPRFWSFVGPKFGDRDPRTITPVEMLDFRQHIKETVGGRDAYTVIKTWRALWQRMATLVCADGQTMCIKDADPSKTWTYGNPAPPSRTAVWRADEVATLISGAWDMDYRGLAVAVAVAWDSQLSPIDVVKLKLGMLVSDHKGCWFQTARSKTQKDAAATLQSPTVRLLEEYIDGLGFDLQEDTSVFWTRGHVPVSRPGNGEHGGDRGGGRPTLPRPYTRPTLTADFRDVRIAVFGKAEDRKLMDMRRSGTVEAFAGGAAPSVVSEKMANTLSHSNALHRTYNPTNIAKVRLADEARLIGRERLRQGEGKLLSGWDALRSVG